ncbi:MAG: protein phosphatase 2C domain-containing protein, partial [Burkholderiales bacterium]|nr:protein phosphatase 2C domain-containing protein [Burkholderiales bacterium]
EAAARSVDRIEALFHQPDLAFEPDTLTALVREAHAELQRYQGDDGPAGRMHCTVVALWIDPTASRALWTHVGDSRLYRLRHGLVDVVTVDDSVVQQMIQAGVLTPEQAVGHPGKNQLLSALGVSDQVDPHTLVRPVEVKQADAYLLCSDGWWESLTPLVLASTLANADSPEQWLARMHERIQATNNPRQDNFSAIAVWVGDPTERVTLTPDDTVPRRRK